MKAAIQGSSEVSVPSYRANSRRLAFIVVYESSGSIRYTHLDNLSIGWGKGVHGCSCAITRCRWYHDRYLHRNTMQSPCNLFSAVLGIKTLRGWWVQDLHLCDWGVLISLCLSRHAIELVFISQRMQNENQNGGEKWNRWYELNRVLYFLKLTAMK